MTDLHDLAETWLADDPDPTTRAEVEALLAAGDAAVLAERFGARLQFGTAGLRGEIGAGPNRMNRALVRRAAAGLAAWLHEKQPSRAGAGVAVCFDGRHLSREFAEDTAQVIAGAGIPVHLLPGPLPTPVLAFAVRHLRAAAGVMVTASHNPPRDNGYKVYDHSGAQIVPPTDAEISHAIDTVGRVLDLPLAPIDDPLVQRLGPDLLDAYVAAVVAMVRSGLDAAGDGERLTVVHSAMHGVGTATVRRVVAAAGFPAMVEVARQAEPDPDFPTVAFPNPEEPGAIDLSLAAARDADADLVVVNDPDADRLAVAVPDAGAAGGWRMLRGDEVGVLLADAVLAHPPRSERDDAEPVVACSLVSSQQLRAMAAAAGIAFEETLTGFKWIARSPGPDRRLLFGYEEALGYCVGDVVADKDGISAALAVIARATELAAQGSSLLARLDDLAVGHGLHVTRQKSFRVEGLTGLEQIAKAMASLRAAPPSQVAGRAVLSFEDLSVPGAWAEPADVLILRLAAGARVIVRPSGTEPKLKCYFEVVRPVPDAAALPSERAAAASDLDALEAAITELLALE